MRIALISEHASPLATLGGVDTGGQNTHVAELATALARAGHEIRVYTRRDDPADPAGVPMTDGVDVVHVPAGPARVLPKDELLPYMPAFGDWLARQWAFGWRPEVAHAHFWMSGLATTRAAVGLAIPVVQTFHALGTVKRRHQGAADTSPPERLDYERWLGRAVTRVVAQCADEVAELGRMGLPSAEITVIPSGVDTTRFRPEGPAVAPGRRPRVLSVGRFVERKGYGELVTALRGVPDAELVLVGGPTGGGVADGLRSLAERSGVADRVRFAGVVPRADMPSWYRSADVLATVPWYEPFGLTPLEAMACGVPVVASAVGGLTDTVVAGVTGDLVPPRDPDALGVTLTRLLDDTRRRQRYGDAAVRRVRTRYTWDTCAARLADLYAEVSVPTPRQVAA